MKTTVSHLRNCTQSFHSFEVAADFKICFCRVKKVKKIKQKQQVKA